MPLQLFLQVHDLMDDIREQQEMAKEISEAISKPAGLGTDVDDDELLAELEVLEQEELDKRLIEATLAPKLPAVPVMEPSRLAAKKKTAAKSDELAELEAWANA